HYVVFFFQAEDGIRGDLVTGVQTCALPICTDTLASGHHIVLCGGCALVRRGANEESRILSCVHPGAQSGAVQDKSVSPYRAALVFRARSAAGLSSVDDVCGCRGDGSGPRVVATSCHV